MRNSSTNSIDSASEDIITLQTLMQKPRSLHKELELGILQQYLDEASLYIKQIPRVPLFLESFHFYPPVL